MNFLHQLFLWVQIASPPLDNEVELHTLQTRSTTSFLSALVGQDSKRNMSTSICTTCLSRLRISTGIVSRLAATTTVIPIASSFHTSAVHQNVVKKKSGAAPVAKFREARSAKIKRKTRDRPKPPPVGERKAQRKRIVLSNTNALEVSGLEYLNNKNMTDQEKLGQMLALEGALLDKLRDSKAFKTTQNWNMFRQPSTLMRQESIELGQDVADINASREDQGMGPRTVHKIIDGERASGKSIHLLQAMSMGFVNDWVVINIPEGRSSHRYMTADTNKCYSTGFRNQPICICTSTAAGRQGRL